MRAVTKLEKQNALLYYVCKECGVQRPGHYFVVTTLPTAFERRKQVMDPEQPCAVCRGEAKG